MKTNEEKIEHLNLVLRAIRNVNKLLVKEKDRTRLLQGICNNFIENRGYYNAWIALLNKSGGLVTTAEAGLGQQFLPIVERLKRGKLPYCAQRALTQSELFLVEDPVSDCTDCPLSAIYAGRGGMTVRLEHEGMVYGILAVSIPKDFVSDEEEQELVGEVAGDIAFGLHIIELGKERKQAEETLRERMHQLGERVKELNCLLNISRLVEKRDISLGEILQGTVDLIPPAWQYTEITCARIILEGQEFKASNFEETNWRLVRDIIVHDESRGALEVCYLEKRPEADEGPFLQEERNLLNAIAERMGRVIERKRAQSTLLKSEKRFRDLVENSPIGISIRQDDQIVYQNPEQERLLGPLPRKSLLTDYENIHPEDLEKVREFYKKIISGEVQTQETDFRFYPTGKIGSKIDMKWVQCRASVIEYREREAILVNIMDVTRARELESFLRIQDKMSSLGRVAAGIAHEIRNPLSGINIYLNTLEKIYDKEEGLEKVKQILGQIQSASTKIESVIRRVMDFSKPSEPKRALTDINKPIEEALNLSSVTLRKRGIQIEKSLAENIQPCLADPHLIEQVILNLITNAAEVMKNIEGDKRIEVASSVANNRIMVKVSDSGPGVPLNLRDKIFDPFYTTKNGGTGIGLSLSRRIITDHGGSLGVSQNKWGGAEFIIEIPIKKSDF